VHSNNGTNNNRRTLSAGYTDFLYKSDIKALVGKSGEGFIPVKAGLKYYFSGGFFGDAQASATFSTESGGGTAFAYTPGIGYTLSNGIETGIRFEGWSHDGSLNQLGLRVAYRF